MPRTTPVSVSECRNEVVPSHRPEQNPLSGRARATPEAWEAILSSWSMFPFPIITFKQDGVWRAINAERMRSADGRRPERT
jgi:hypothetical protein